MYLDLLKQEEKSVFCFSRLNDRQKIKKKVRLMFKCIK